MPLQDRIHQNRLKRLLSIDDGGIRGVLSLKVLQKIEDLFKSQIRQQNFRLADYFDYNAGTSTSGIIPAGLSIDLSVAEILTFYQEAIAQMFVKANLLRCLRYKFENKLLADKLKQVFEAKTTLGSDKPKTPRLLVMSNAIIYSPWPLSNKGTSRDWRCWLRSALRSQCPTLLRIGSDHWHPESLDARVGSCGGVETTAAGETTGMVLKIGSPPPRPCRGVQQPVDGDGP